MKKNVVSVFRAGDAVLSVKKVASTAVVTSSGRVVARVVDGGNPAESMGKLALAKSATPKAGTLKMSKFVVEVEKSHPMLVGKLVGKDLGGIFKEARKCLSPVDFSKLVVTAAKAGYSAPSDWKVAYFVGKDMLRQGASKAEVTWEISKPTYGLAGSVNKVMSRICSNIRGDKLFDVVMRGEFLHHGVEAHLGCDVDPLKLGDLVKVLRVKKGRAAVASLDGKVKAVVGATDLYLPRVFREGTAVQAYCSSVWKDGIVVGRKGSVVRVKIGKQVWKVPSDSVRYASSDIADAAIEYGESLCRVMTPVFAAERVAAEFSLSEGAKRQLQSRFMSGQKGSGYFFGDPVVVRQGESTFQGRFLKSSSSGALVEFGDGQAVVSFDKVAPWSPGEESNVDIVMSCGSAEVAAQLKKRLEGAGMKPQLVAANELCVPEDGREAEIYELAYEEIPLERVSSVVVDGPTVGRAKKFGMSMVGDVFGKRFSTMSPGDRADKDVKNAETGEVLFSSGSRISEVELGLLRKFGQARLSRSATGSLEALPASGFDHRSDPYLTREVVLTLANSEHCPDDVIVLKDGALFMEKGSAVTEGIKSMLASAGHLAFANSFERKYGMGSATLGQLGSSYDITRLEKTSDGKGLDYGVNLTFVDGGQKYGVQISASEAPLLDGQKVDLMGFQTAVLSKMAEVGLGEPKAYSWSRGPQFVMLASDLVWRIGKLVGSELQVVSLNDRQVAPWLQAGKS